MSSSLKRLSKLGEGASGSVYEVDYAGKNCALKVNFCPLNSEGSSLRELHMHKNLKHPHILELIGTIRGRVELSTPISPHKMEVASKQDLVHFLYPLAKCDLFAYIEGNMKVTLEIALKWLVQLALALEYLHLSGYIHRDIKPDNVLLVEENGELVCKITDFGFAKYYSAHAVNSPSTGTVCYNAPECLMSLGCSQTSDIWGLGCIIKELISGEPLASPALVTHADVLSAYGAALPPAEYLSSPMSARSLSTATSPQRLLGVSSRRQDVIDLVMGMLAPDPSDRLTATEILNSHVLDEHREFISEMRQEYTPLDPADRIVVRSARSERTYLRALIDQCSVLRDKDWYKDDSIIFSTVDLFDILLSSRAGAKMSNEMTTIYFRVCMHVAVSNKFSIGRERVSLEGLLPASLRTPRLINQALTAREKLISLLDGMVMLYTAYDHAGPLTEMQTMSLLNFVIRDTEQLTVRDLVGKWRAM